MKLLVTSDLHRGFSKNTHLIHDRFAEKLAALEWDVLVLAGDLASHKPHQYEGVMRWARKLAGTRSVVCVRGNHDHWGGDHRKITDLSLLRDLHRRDHEEYDIWHLEEGAYIGWQGYTIVGWDGWWAGVPIDLHRMPRLANGNLTDNFLKRECEQRFGDALLAAETARPDKIIAVTHFPVAPNADLSYGGNPRYWEFLSPHIDVLIYGHSHRRVDEVIDGVRVVNAGSDYDKPNHLIVEI